jgi:xanthine/CO dehydrogenase XdhC/CoxF family maturation factor
MREIGDIIRVYEAHAGEPMAFATLVRTRGSSYRRAGARMLVTQHSHVAGSLSGGCLEEEIADRSRAVLLTGEPARVVFDTRRRFGCNGSLDILIERASRKFLGRLAENFRSRQPTTIATDWTAGQSRIVAPFEGTGEADLLQTIHPPIQLLVMGDGPDSAALSSIAHALGWTVRAFDSASQFEPDYDDRTAAIVKSHNYGRDFAALRALLPRSLRYVGLLGSRARREQLLGDLLDTGVEPGANLFAPAGLDLGGESPEAIALAIIAEIQATFGQGTAQFLRDRKAPIHRAVRPPAAL